MPRKPTAVDDLPPERLALTLAVRCARCGGLDEVIAAVRQTVSSVFDEAPAALFLRAPYGDVWQAVGGEADPALAAGFTTHRAQLSADELVLVEGEPARWHVRLVHAAVRDERARISGCISLAPGRAPKEHDLELLEAIAAGAAEALAVARQADEDLRRDRWRAAYSAIPRLAHATDDRDALLDVISESIAVAVDGRGARIFLREPITRGLEPRGGSQAAAGDDERGIAHAAFDLDRLVVGSFSADELLGPGARQLAAAPLHDHEGRRIGALVYARRIVGRILDEEDLQPLDVLAGVASLALDLQQTRAAERRLRAGDPETGCLVGEQLESAIELALESDRRASASTALVAVQLDDTGKPYDTELTQAVARAFLGLARDYDLMIARTGRQIFAVIAPNHSEREARLLAGRLRLLVRHGLSGRQSVTACAGVAVAPECGTSGPELVAAALDALERARAKGTDNHLSASGRVRPRPLPGRYTTEDERLQMLMTLARVVDEVQFHGVAHSEAVAQRAHDIAIALELPPESVDAITLAGGLHDIGRTLLPAELLARRDLNDTESGAVRGHVVLGARLVASAGRPDVAALIASLHERWDGTGTPARTAGDAIPLGSRVLAIVNAFETILESLGRGASGFSDAAAHLVRERGASFDPALVDLLLRRAQSKRRESAAALRAEAEAE